MPNLNKTISKAGGFATAFVGAVATEHLAHGGAPVFLVLSHLLTHIGSELIGPIGEEIIEQFKSKRPNELNHDIQRELIESMQQATEGIELLYKDKFPDQPLSRQTKKFLKRFRKEFFDEFSLKAGYTVEEIDLKKIIYSSDSRKENKWLYQQDGENVISKALNERLSEELEKEHVDSNFQSFFLEKFLPLTQFNFGERLKHDKNGAARRAMERMLSEETLAGINKLIHLQESHQNELRNEKFLAKAGKLSPGKLSQLKSLVKEWNEPKRLEAQFSKALEDRFTEMVEQYKSLHTDIIGIKFQLHGIRKVLSTNMQIGLMIIIVSVIIATTLLVRNQHRPFDVSVTLAKEEDLKNLREYPALKYPIKLKLLFPDGKKEMAMVNESSEGYFPKLPSEWLHKKIPVTLDDPYWKLSSDSMLLSDKTSRLIVKPNDVLRNLSGNVFSKKDGSPIVNVQVKLSDTTVYTNEDGSYKIKLVDYMLKEKQEIHFFAEGFEAYVDIFLPNSTPGEVRLTPLKQKK